MKHRVRPKGRSFRKLRRRGTALYMAVLSTTLIVSLLGLAGLSIVRIERKQESISSDRLVALANARSAVEIALRVIANDSDWRNTYTNGVETTPQSLGPKGTGTISWVLEDSDGSLTDADTNLRLKGVGRVDNTVQVSSIKLEGTPQILDVFQRATYSAQDVLVAGQITAVGGPVSTPATMTVNNTLTGDAEADTIVGDGLVTGATTTPFDPLTMPSPTVFDDYAAMATPINFWTLPDGKIQKRVVSAASNPFGAPDAEGIYYVDVPPGQTLDIRQSRIVGTFVVQLNSYSKLTVVAANLWQTGGNYPMMIVKGTTGSILDLNGFASGILNEWSLKVNFNPPGTPYEGGSDLDNIDQYPNEFHGLIHVIGPSTTVQIGSNFVLRGSLVSEGRVTLGSNYFVTLDSQLFTNPPQGYSMETGDVTPVAGSWLWDAAP